MNKNIISLEKAIKIYGDKNMYYDNDIKLEQTGIVKRNSDIAIYKYRFEPIENCVIDRTEIVS